MCYLLSRVRLFVTPLDSSPPGSSVPGILQARILEWGCQFLLQGISPTQGLNPDLPRYRQILYRLSHWQVGLENIPSGSSNGFPCLRHDNQLRYLKALSFLVWFVFSICVTLSSLLFPMILWALTPESLLQFFFLSEQVSESERLCLDFSLRHALVW